MAVNQVNPNLPPDDERDGFVERLVEGAIDGAADSTPDCCCIVGEVFDGVGDCFVATAANDDDLVAPQVTTLRAYRDQRMARYGAGRVFTRYYYRWGRYGAWYLRRYPALKPLVRGGLAPLVRYARWQLKRRPAA